MYDLYFTFKLTAPVTGPCEFLVMYDPVGEPNKQNNVTGPCEFLVMYDVKYWSRGFARVTGPCEFLVMYDIPRIAGINSTLQDPVNF